MDHKFSIHSAFYPQLMMFLFKNAVPRQDLEELSKASRDLKGLPNQLDKFSKMLNTVISRVDVIEKRLK